MSYKLSISNIVNVPVRFELNDAGKQREFKLTLVCERLDIEEIRKLEDGGDALVGDFVRRVARDWKDQTLVLDANDKPAAFDSTALDVLLEVRGMPTMLYIAYMRECGARAKN